MTLSDRKKVTVVIVLALILLFMALPAYALHLPDIKKGAALKTQGRFSITPTVTAEIVEIDFSKIDIKLDLGIAKINLNSLGRWMGTWAIDAGIGNDLAFVSFSKILVPVIEFQLGAFWGYDFDRYDGGFETGFIISAILW